MGVVEKLEAMAKKAIELDHVFLGVCYLTIAYFVKMGLISEEVGEVCRHDPDRFYNEIRNRRITAT